MIEWNNQVKLIISDVDETIADLYMEAKHEMIIELEKILSEGKVLFLISGQSIGNIQWRIVDHIQRHLRKRIIVGHCSGAEVWGFNENGNLQKNPFYSLYDSTLSELQKKKWRDVISDLIEYFQLEVYPPMPVKEFTKKSGQDPLSIMLEDRGPQITFEVTNGYNLSLGKSRELAIKAPIMDGHLDIRIPILYRAKDMLMLNNVPITPRLAGVFAIDFAVKGVSKTTAVKYIIKHNSILNSRGIQKSDIDNPESIEVWGDKFSITQGGTDRHICEALPKAVRSITFREENPVEFLDGYNIVVWEGKRHLHEGLLEFLQSRKQR
jgi:hydroxymethylpyrimidine pyrophosphatase-like HAD family hydrolase